MVVTLGWFFVILEEMIRLVQSPEFLWRLQIPMYPGIT